MNRWIPQRLVSLGTDGFGRSESRRALRDFFEVDARYIALATLHGLAQEGKVKPDTLKKAIKQLEIDPNKPNPLRD
jgi:pyruvate dehydrogenase E1 component